MDVELLVFVPDADSDRFQFDPLIVNSKSFHRLIEHSMRTLFS